MSVIIGMNFGYYALLASDTRVTHLHLDGRRERVVDHVAKVRTTSMGVATGVGLCSLIDVVIDRLDARRPERFGQISELALEERAKAEARHADDASTLESIQWATSWMLTSAMGDHISLFDIHPRGQYQARQVEANDAAIGFPFGITDRQVATAGRMLRKGFKPSSSPSEFAESLAHHSRLAAEIVQWLASVNTFVSPGVQFGLHVLEDVYFVTGIVAVDGFPGIRLAGVADQPVGAEVRPIEAPAHVTA